MSDHQLEFPPGCALGRADAEKKRKGLPAKVGAKQAPRLGIGADGIEIFFLFFDVLLEALREGSLFLTLQPEGL